MAVPSYKSRGKVGAIALVALAAVANVYLHLWLIGPQEKRLEELKAGYVKERKLVDQARRSLEQEFPPQKEKDGLKLLTRKEQNVIVHQVAGLADDLGLVLRPISYRPEAALPDGMTKLTVTLAMDGYYPELKQFIYAMEVAPFPIVIEEVSFKRRSLEEDEVELSMVFFTLLKK